MVVTGASDIVQTQSATVATTIAVKQIQQLPVITHTALDYVVSLPGVETPGSDTRSSTVNGLPRTAMNITLDGNFPGGINTTYAGYARNLYGFLTGRVTNFAGTCYARPEGTYELYDDRTNQTTADDIGLFVSDSFRFKPNLTLTAGVRPGLRRRHPALGCAKSGSGNLYLRELQDIELVQRAEHVQPEPHKRLRFEWDCGLGHERPAERAEPAGRCLAPASGPDCVQSSRGRARVRRSAGSSPGRGTGRWTSAS